MPEVSVRAATAEFLRWADRVLSKSTARIYRSYLEKFASAFGELALVKLTQAKVTAWNKKYHPLQAVQRLCGWAAKEGRLVPENPLERMPMPYRAPRHRTLDRRDILTLLRRAKRPFRDLLLSLAESMARPIEMRSVRWEMIRTFGDRPANVDDIRQGRAFFVFHKFKGQTLRKDELQVRTIPINGRLAKNLARRMRANPDPKQNCFPNSRGQQWTKNAVRIALRRLRRSLGWGTDFRGENVVAYTLRHSGATDAVRAGVREFRLAALLGHASTRTTARYVHLSPYDAVSDAATIEEFRRTRRM